MQAAEISIGKTYAAKISGRVVPVLIRGLCVYGGWYGLNMVTRKKVRIKSAAKLRREYIEPKAQPMHPDNKSLAAGERDE